MILETCNRSYRSSQSNQIKNLTHQIDRSFKETARSVFQIGRCLHQLKQLMSNDDFLKLAETRWNMSRMSAHRFVTCYLTFKDKKSRALLGAKPSVMYIISTLDDPQKVAALAAGKKVQVCGEMKTIDQLTVKDARRIKETSKSAVVHTEAGGKKRRVDKLHEEIATAFESLDDIARTIKRFNDQGIKILHREELKDYAILVIENMRDVLCLLN